MDYWVEHKLGGAYRNPRDHPSPDEVRKIIKRLFEAGLLIQSNYPEHSSETKSSVHGMSVPCVWPESYAAACGYCRDWVEGDQSGVSF